ncbi:Uncharacterised protein [Vibrio cholerae]|nr:Uncharacterised protein [Vibrio cholerae]CSI62065.1 Uncharacterised protein [Vibrio cholerae]
MRDRHQRTRTAFKADNPLFSGSGQFSDALCSQLFLAQFIQCSLKIRHEQNTALFVSFKRLAAKYHGFDELIWHWVTLYIFGIGFQPVSIHQ